MIAKRRRGVDDFNNISPKSRGCEVVKRTRRIPRPSPPTPAARQTSYFQKDHDKSSRSARAVESPYTRDPPAAELHQERRRKCASAPSRAYRHNAIGAELIASFNDRDITAMGICASGELGLKALVVMRSSSPVTRDCPVSSCTSIAGKFRYEADPHTSDTYGARSKIFSPPAAPRTPGRQLLALRPILLIIRQPVKDLLLRLVANRTSVIKHQPGLFDGRHLAIPLLQERPDDLSESWAFIWQPKVSR